MSGKTTIEEHYEEVNRAHNKIVLKLEIDIEVLRRKLSVIVEEREALEKEVIGLKEKLKSKKSLI